MEDIKDTCEKKTLDGKQIILQRLRNNKNSRKFRFLEAEIRDHIFDFYSPKYNNYRLNAQALRFPTINKKETIQTVLKNEKPFWMSQQQFDNLMQFKNDENKFLTEVEHLVNKYDDLTNKQFSKLVNMYEQQKQNFQDKNQNTLFQVNYIISGKFDDGTEFRAPFDFQEIESLNIDHVTRKVSIKLGQKVCPNIPFISWVGNRYNIEIESSLKNIDFSIDEEYIREFLKIYEKLGIRIDRRYFDGLEISELKLCRENRSIKDDKSTALHEAKHAVVALYYEFDVDTIDINNNEDTLGKVLSYIDDEADARSLICVALAPYYDKESLTYNQIIQETENEDYQTISEQINRIVNDFSAKEKIFQECLSETKKIIDKLKSKIDLFSNELLKQRLLTNDDILSLWNNDEISTSNLKDNKTLKFEKNKFVVEKVKLIALCPEIAELDIFKDVENIFEKTDFIENFLNKNKNEEITSKMDESQIAWGFDADMSQQKAVYDTLLNDNTIIQGPPGTGKTQTILNIISNALNHHKKVLVVTEKTTAVEVIHDRFKEQAKELANFIFDLYNVDKLNIGFYQELGKKLSYIDEHEFAQYKKIAYHKNMQDKVDKINKLAHKIEKLDLSNLEKLSDEIKVTDQDIDLIQSLIETKSLNKLAGLTSIWIEEIKEWKNQKDRLLNFKNTYFGQNILDSKILSLFELNKSTPYSVYNSHCYASLLLRDKPKVWFFLRKKFRKIANEHNFDCLFGKDFNLFTNYMQFDFKKFSDDDLLLLADIEKINSSCSSLERIIKIANYLDKKQVYMNLLNDINSLDLYAYDNVNNHDNFHDCHEYLFNQWRATAFHPGLSSFDKNSIKELEYCAQRQKMTKVVREIIFNHWNYIYRTFPIVLATPEVLSKYVPCEKDLYDIVIIDEASQFLIERSIPALYRGKQHIISGDKMQLRPKTKNRFSIDKYTKNDTIKYSELVEAESVLDLFEHLFGRSGTMLTTHYRSEKHELIDFSNRHFYNNKLNFIEKIDSVANKIAIEIINVRGKWIDQTNQVEANKIIKKLEEIYSLNKDASVGVIVFSKRQCNLIKKTLYRSHNKNLLRSFWSIDSNTLFIKSIDEVQGEERETIIFGITYGDNVYNYMLLSETFARNKINVAITRAKKQIIIIKSHKSYEYRRIKNDFKDSGSSTLFNYLEYAENLSSLDSYQVNDLSVTSEIDQKLKRYLVDKEIQVFKTIPIKDKQFYLVKNKDQIDVYYSIDTNCMKDARNQIWFYESFLKCRGYQPKPILFDELYNIK